MSKTCSHFAFSLLVLRASPLETRDENSRDDGKHMWRRLPFSSQRTRRSPSEAQPMLGTRPHSCLTRSETGSCRNGRRRREKCTACDVQEEGPLREGEAGRKMGT